MHIWHPVPMTPDLLFSGVATANLSSALPWFEALLGGQADVIVTDDEVMWQVCDGGWLFLIQDPIRAGSALVTIAVSDLDQTLTEIAGRGIDNPSIETIPEAGRKTPLVDPEGNMVTFIQVLTSTDWRRLFLHSNAEGRGDRPMSDASAPRLTPRGRLSSRARLTTLLLFSHVQTEWMPCRLTMY
jgi:predicted enzyme related to lactoylglutathione lyase